MKKRITKSTIHNIFPVLLEKDEDGVYIVECPIFSGCYSQGKTVDQALKKIKEVILLCLQEKDNQERAKAFVSRKMSLRSVTV